MANGLKRVVYTSTLTDLVDPPQVETLLQQARFSNQRAGITGILIVGGDQVIQCLEGSPASVDGLVDRISTDIRHEDMKVVYSGEVENRLFPEWSMGFVSIKSEDLKPLLSASGATSMALSDRLTENSDITSAILNGFVKVLEGKSAKVDMVGMLARQDAYVRSVF